MRSTGVNIDRAKIFIQTACEEYRLDVNTYFELQRFTTKLWTETEVTETETEGRENGHSSTSSTATDCNEVSKEGY